MTRSFFKTRNSSTLHFHVVFLMGIQFRSMRLALRIAKVSFLVTHIHINLLSIIIFCTHILPNEKVDLYVNENLRGHVYNLKLQQIGNILHFIWRHWNFLKMEDKMENRKEGICKHYEISICLCNPVDLMKMPPHLILNICNRNVC